MRKGLVHHTGIERRFFTAFFWLLVGGLYLGVFFTRRVPEYAYAHIAFAIPFCVLVYAYVTAPKRVKVRRYTLSLLPPGETRIRIAYLSDIHTGDQLPQKQLERVTRLLSHERPDVILIGGDMVEREASTIGQLKAWKSLMAPLGIFAILGNHDYEDRPKLIREMYAKLGWIDATNTRFTITKGGASIELMGTDDTFFGHPDVELLHSAHTLPRIVLAHSPDTMLDLQPGDANLVLAGHTHGGQIRLPFIGPIVRLPQRGPRTWDRGYKTVRGIPLIISTGLGLSGPSVRLFCPPELVIVDLVGV